MSSSLPRVILKRNEEKRILQGHPWIYGNEISRIEGNPAPGGIVDAVTSRGLFLGRGYYNEKSAIRIRLLTRRAEPIDRDFFHKRIKLAWQYRRDIGYTECCRVIFGEADRLPGLVVDKFGPYLCVQTLALGIDNYKDVIVELLEEVIEPLGIYERNDVSVRKKEGLPLVTGFLKGPFDTRVVVTENGIPVEVDLAGGNKTGYFLDQRENHLAVERISSGRDILDAFCHTGGFTLHALRGGARHVVCVDISADAIAGLAKNTEHNGWSDRVTPVTANVFDLLRQYEADGRTFDMIVLDPPAFAKSRSALDGAYRGYKEINLRAFKMLRPGGILVSCSCSYHMHEHTFLRMLADAAADAEVTARITEIRGQAPDHPVLLGYDESRYLTCVILKLA